MKTTVVKYEGPPAYYVYSAYDSLNERVRIIFASSALKARKLAEEKYPDETPILRVLRVIEAVTTKMTLKELEEIAYGGQDGTISSQ